MRRRWLYVGVAVFGLAVAVGALVAWATCDCTSLPVETMAARVIAGLAFINVGIIALRRRGSGRVGALMCAVGFAWFVDDLGWVYAPLPSTVSHFGAAFFQPLLAHLAIAFPSGRLRARFDRWLVGSVYVAWLVLTLALLSVWDPADAGCSTCPRNLLLIYRAPQVHDFLDGLSTGITLIQAALVVGVVLRHWLIASVPARRALAPVLWASLPLAGVVAEYSLVGRSATPAWAPLALAALPVGFLVGLLRISLSRAAVGRLVIELGDTPPAGWRPTQLRDALARTLHDPSLQVAYWLPARQVFVDPAGAPVLLPDEDNAGRVTTLLERGGEPIAVLIHDAAVRDDPELVEAVGAAARLAIENGRMEAEIRAQLQEVRASRTRLVEAAGAERRRIERNLHDGSQQRLVNLALALSIAQSRLRPDVDAELASMLSEASEELKLALAELRELARGIHPTLLSEAGLGPALVSLAERAPLPVLVTAVPAERLAPGLEVAAYFVVAECLTNAAKHAVASSATVRVERIDGQLVVQVSDDGVGGADLSGGTGLQGLADRVGALDGRLVVESPPSGGTRVIATIPCT